MGVFAIKGRRILVIRKLLRNFNHLAIESPGDLTGKHSETANCELVFHVTLIHH